MRFILVRARAGFGKRETNLFLGLIALFFLFFCCSRGTQKREGERGRKRERKRTRNLIIFFSSSFHFLLAYLLGTFIDFSSSLIIKKFLQPIIYADWSFFLFGNNFTQ